MCDKSGRGQVEHLTVREILQNSLSLLPLYSVSTCAMGGELGMRKTRCLCVHVQRNSQSSELSLAETDSPSMSCLKSVLTLCHNLDSRALIISPFHITKPASQMVDSLPWWHLADCRGKQLPNEQEVVYPKTLDALIRHMSARRREININIHETVTLMKFPRVQRSEVCKMCSSQDEMKSRREGDRYSGDHCSQRCGQTWSPGNFPKNSENYLLLLHCLRLSQLVEVSQVPEIMAHSQCLLENYSIIDISDETLVALSLSSIMVLQPLLSCSSNCCISPNNSLFSLSYLENIEWFWLSDPAHTSLLIQESLTSLNFQVVRPIYYAIDYFSFFPYELAIILINCPFSVVHVMVSFICQLG